MRATIAIPSFSRPDILQKNAIPFAESIGLPFKINIEQGQKELYPYLKDRSEVVYSANGVGVIGAIENLKKNIKTELIFKVDDDISGFTGKLSELFPKFLQSFEKYPKLGAIVFPYQHEFYYSENKLFSHMNARCQTSYLIRRELVGGENIFDPFEDFCHFLKLRAKGYFTFLSPTTKIKCKPVGNTPGGLNASGFRDKRSLSAIQKIQEAYPFFNIGLRNKPEKSWKYEPDFSKEPMLKKTEI